MWTLSLSSLPRGGWLRLSMLRRGIGMRGQVVILVSDTWSITCRPDLIILAVIFRELNETSSDYSVANISRFMAGVLSDQQDCSCLFTYGEDKSSHGGSAREISGLDSST
ncbi:hypothetical protein WJX79_008994 [Trebouxia sp. C0005]